jgi:hypothetical protein
VPQAGGSLEIADGRATLQLHDMPDLGGARAQVPSEDPIVSVPL